MLRHNKRFAVEARVQEDLHRDIPAGINLDSVLCIRTVKALRNDFTVAHDKKLYQVLKAVSAKTVMLEEKVNGSMFITHNNVRLPFREILVRPEILKEPVPAHPPRIMPAKPIPDHPWRKRDTFVYKKMRNQGSKPLQAANV